MTERAKHAAKVRDERHTDPIPRQGNAKNTKKWCRGVVGRTHNPEWVNYAEAKNVSGRIFGDWRIYRCQNCGRELDYDFGKRR